MFPMITTVEEVVQAKEYLEKVKQELKAEKVFFDENIKVGVMMSWSGLQPDPRRC